MNGLRLLSDIKVLLSLLTGKGRGSANTILLGTQSWVVGEGAVLLEKYSERPYPSALQH